MNAKLCKDMLKKISAFHKKIKNQQIVFGFILFTCSFRLLKCERDEMVGFHFISNTLLI